MQNSSSALLIVNSSGGQKVYLSDHTVGVEGTYKPGLMQLSTRCINILHRPLGEQLTLKKICPAKCTGLTIVFPCC